MAATEIDADWLADHPIPVPGDESTKRDRGTVVVAGATAETPGALLLAGLAALRAGAGRLQVLAPQPVAVALGVAIPEAQVTGVEIDGSGTVAPDDRLRAAFSAADVILVGPGLGGDVDAAPLVAEALAASDAVGARVVADAGAVAALATSDRRRAGVAGRLVATPNVAEA
ncbi:MAG: NAD(P)H-hydrate dehydratase, partial [Aquihabitans sp.]